MNSIVNELDMQVIDTAVRDGTAAGGRMSAYWEQLIAAGIPPGIAGGLAMQYQAILLSHSMPAPPSIVQVEHRPYDGEAEEW